MKKILAVTACPAGVAHTYMVAEKIQKAIERAGYEAKVETQGAIGIENKITEEDFEGAVGAIFAKAIAVIEEERFSSIPVLEISLQEALKDADGCVNELLEAVGER